MVVVVVVVMVAAGDGGWWCRGVGGCGDGGSGCGCGCGDDGEQIMEMIFIFFVNDFTYVHVCFSYFTCLEAFPMDNRCTRLIILGLWDPHLIHTQEMLGEIKENSNMLYSILLIYAIYFIFAPLKAM